MTEHEGTHQEHETSHEYDGIKENDHPLPMWWLLTFYGTIVFAFVYFFGLEQAKAILDPTGEYDREVLVARQKSGKTGYTPEELVALARNPDAVAEGRATYQQVCATCHGDKGEGKIGPNLTDHAWLHGGAPDKVYTTVSKGVTEKGMPAWEPSLGSTKTAKVVAFVLSVKNTNVPGKAAQGAEEP